MTTCPRCGTERTLSGYCGFLGQQAVCDLRAELRDARAERDHAKGELAAYRLDVALMVSQLRGQVRSMGDERDAALAATAEWRHTMVQREVDAAMRDHDASLDAARAELRDVKAAVLDRKQRVEHPVCLCGDTITPDTINADNCLLTPDGWVCGMCNSAAQKGATNVPL